MWPTGKTVEGGDAHLLESLGQFSASVVWRACSRVVSMDIQRLVAMLGLLDFQSLELDVDGFPEFLLWLHSLVGGNNSLLLG